MRKLAKVFRAFRKGDRIRVAEISGFHKGALGTIDYITPDGCIWVLRDGASSVVYFHAFELEFENLEDGFCFSEKIFEDKFLDAHKNNEIAGDAQFSAGARWAWEEARKIFEEQYT